MVVVVLKVHLVLLQLAHEAEVGVNDVTETTHVLKGVVEGDVQGSHEVGNTDSSRAAPTHLTVHQHLPSLLPYCVCQHTTFNKISIQYYSRSLTLLFSAMQLIIHSRHSFERER